MSSLSQIGLTLPEKGEKYSLDIINQNNKIIDDEIKKINEKFIEVENKFTALESDCDWKKVVDTFEDIETKYPNPEDGWTVNVKDTNYTWRYNGEKWIPISANAIPIVTDNISGILNKDDYMKFKQTSLGMQIDGETVYLDKKDGKIGYNTDPERGADTFIPFKSSENSGENGNEDELKCFNVRGSVPSTNTYDIYSISIDFYVPEIIQEKIKRVVIKDFKLYTSVDSSTSRTSTIYFRMYRTKKGTSGTEIIKSISVSSSKTSGTETISDEEINIDDVTKIEYFTLYKTGGTGTGKLAQYSLNFNIELYI